MSINPISFLLLAFINLPSADCAVSFIKHPDDPTIVFHGSNSTNVSLHWKCDLDGNTFGSFRIERYVDKSNVILVAVRFGLNGENTLSEEHFAGRGMMTGSGCEATLLIFNVSLNDGKYTYRSTVTTTNSGKFIKSQFENKFIVVVAAHNVAVECGDAVLGQTMTCNCTADGHPAPSFQWRASNGSDLGNGSSYTTPLVERTLNGNYFICVASNGFGPNKDMNSSIFDVKEKPRSVEISPHPSVTVNETDNATLKCKASGGNPADYHYKWQHNGNDISGRENGNLTLIGVQRNENGNYSCQGCNMAGCTSSNSTSLIVHYKPNSVQISPHPSVRLNETGNTTMTCQASGGNPAVYHYKWQHNGNDISGGENGTVTLINVQRNQNGNYFCLGCNMIGCTSNSTGLIIQYRPANVSIVADPDSTVAAGKSLTLNCTFDSGNLPVYYIEWKFNASMQQLTDRSLVIKEVNISNSGKYECTAKNSLGNATGKIDITVTYTSGSDPKGKKGLSTETIVIIVVVVVTLVIVIIAVVVWRVKKNRCSKKRKVANRKEELHLYSEPSLEVEHTPYAEVTGPQDERSKKGKKPVALYAEVDMSKKSKKKKPGDLLYADLATIPPGVATENSNTQQPAKKPEKHQSTDYAHITDVFKEEDGKSVKVPIAASNRNKTNNGSIISEP